MNKRLWMGLLTTCGGLAIAFLAEVVSPTPVFISVGSLLVLVALYLQAAALAPVEGWSRAACLQFVRMAAVAIAAIPAHRLLLWAK